MTETPETQATRRPWHIWAVGITSLLWNAMGAYDYLMTETQNQAYMSQFTPEQLEFFYGFPAWVVAAWAIAVWGGVIASLLLLLRKRLAMPAFLVSLIGMVITLIHNFGLSNGAEVIGAFGMSFSALIFVVAVALVLYTRVMSNRGVLS